MRRAHLACQNPGPRRVSFGIKGEEGEVGPHCTTLHLATLSTSPSPPPLPPSLHLYLQTLPSVPGTIFSFSCCLPKSLIIYILMSLNEQVSVCPPQVQLGYTFSACRNKGLTEKRTQYIRVVWPLVVPQGCPCIQVKTDLEKTHLGKGAKTM